MSSLIESVPMPVDYSTPPSAIGLVAGSVRPARGVPRRCTIFAEIEGVSQIALGGGSAARIAWLGHAGTWQMPRARLRSDT